MFSELRVFANYLDYFTCNWLVLLEEFHFILGQIKTAVYNILYDAECYSQNRKIVWVVIISLLYKYVIYNTQQMFSEC